MGDTVCFALNMLSWKKYIHVHKSLLRC